MALVLVGVAVVALAAVVGWLLACRHAAASRQTQRDLLDENLVHAMAELVLRQDALTREVRRALDAVPGATDDAADSSDEADGLSRS